MPDELAEHAPSLRQLADLPALRRVDARGEEPVEPPAGRVEDAQCGEARAGHVTGDLEQTLQDPLGVDGLDERAPDGQQLAVLIVTHDRLGANVTADRWRR